MLRKIAVETAIGGRWWYGELWEWLYVVTAIAHARSMVSHRLSHLPLGNSSGDIVNDGCLYQKHTLDLEQQSPAARLDSIS